ncbi:MAG: 3-deoxy-manno-octulosonate cytidylyltransferase, partial [Selenomonadaceae bacterium]|nr:3-deoxy-manno-octulosonate cytidylyltransferase [Selenomonadaceae bacterium]
MKAICVIPARYKSTRLPGKPLKEICGVPMICRVWQRASLAKAVDEVIVATDDERIFAAVEKFSGRAMMTRTDHKTGTDRLAEVAEKFPDVDIVVNVQGDEPLIEPALIDELVAEFADENLQMATVATELTDEADFKNPNNVKVVVDCSNNALYFSRATIPFPRNAGKSPVFKHIGIYAYRRNFLLSYAKMESTPLEQTESLEQLRALENGYKIRV